MVHKLCWLENKIKLNKVHLQHVADMYMNASEPEVSRHPGYTFSRHL